MFIDINKLVSLSTARYSAPNVFALPRNVYIQSSLSISITCDPNYVSMVDAQVYRVSYL